MLSFKQLCYYIMTQRKQRNFDFGSSSEDQPSNNQSEYQIEQEQLFQAKQTLQQCILCNGSPFRQKYKVQKVLYLSQVSKILLISEIQKFQEQSKLFCLKLAHQNSIKTELQFLQTLGNSMLKHTCTLFVEIIDTVFIGLIQKKIKGFIMPYYEENLSKVIRRNKFGMKCVEITKFLNDMSEAMIHLNDNTIIHGDIKPENIIVSQNNGKICFKLIDFGNSFKSNKQSPNFSLKPTQTLQYRSPQAIYKRGNYKIDIWSIGCIVFQCLTGSSLIPQQIEYQKQLELFFCEIQDWEKFIQISIGKWIVDIRKVQHIVNILGKMLRWEENQRLSAKELKQLLEKSVQQAQK